MSTKTVSNTVPYKKLHCDSIPIGGGSIGIVLKAVHEDWGCEVAYKKLQVAYINDEQAKNDLKNEAEIHRQLRHPNIVSMLGCVFEDLRGQYGLVLEYFYFGSLDNFLQCFKDKKAPTVSWKLKTKMAYDMCCGMSYLHSLIPNAVIHGDLKIQNLLVGEHLNIKISDFGLSKWKDLSRTRTLRSGGFVGTLSHIPPEHFDDSVAARTEMFDVYSSGILLWELFTEETAFARHRPEMIALRVIRGERPEVEKVPTVVPLQIRTSITKCWEQRPVDRTTFSELVASLKPYIRTPEAVCEIESSVRDLLSFYHGQTSTKQQSPGSDIVDSCGVQSSDVKLEMVRHKLSSNIRRTDRILEYLHQKRAVTSPEYDEIRSQRTVVKLTDKLIDVLKRKPVTAYQHFLQALCNTSQYQLFCFLQEGGDLNTDHKEAVIDNHAFLKEQLLVSKTTLLDHLLQHGVLDEQEFSEIKSKTTESDKVEQLLFYIMRTSHDQYEQFLSALNSSSQRDIADRLQAATALRLLQQETSCNMTVPAPDENTDALNARLPHVQPRQRKSRSTPIDSTLNSFRGLNITMTSSESVLNELHQGASPNAPVAKDISECESKLEMKMQSGLKDKFGSTKDIQAQVTDNAANMESKKKSAEDTTDQAMLPLFLFGVFPFLEPLVRVILESPKKDGGKIQLYEYAKACKRAHITFEDSKVAERLLKKGSFMVEQYKITISKDCYVVYVHGINSARADLIVTLMEHPRNGGGPIVHNEWANNTLTVYFQQKQDLESILKKGSITILGHSYILTENPEPSPGASPVTVSSGSSISSQPPDLSDNQSSATTPATLSVNCSICNLRPRNAMFLPCTHAFCSNCADPLTECLTCKADIMQKMILFELIEV